MKQDHETEARSGRAEGSFTRRDVLKMGGIGALSMAGVAALSACSPASSSSSTGSAAQTARADEAAPASSDTLTKEASKPSGTVMWPDKPGFLNDALEIADEDISETVDVDIVVCGAGIAGVAAVREAAAEQGLTVAVFEKTAGVQGRSGDFGAINAACTERYGMTGLDVTEVVGELMRESGYKANYSILEAWASNSGADLDWYFGALPDLPYLDSIMSPQPTDAEYWVQPERYPLPDGWSGNADEYYPCFQTTVRMYPDHVPCLQANFDIAQESGNVKMAKFYTPVVKLIKEGSRVTGVIAHDDENDTYIRANAAKGVILATGDYSGNTDMLYYYNPDTTGIMTLYSGMDIDGKASNTGDGQCLGMQVGAMMEATPHAPMIHHMGSCMGSSCFLELNANGLRFMNEDVPGQQLENQIEGQPGKYSYQFFDGAWKDQVPHFKPEHGACCYVLEDGVITSGDVNDTLTHKDSFAFQEQIDDAVEAGETLKADTIDELLKLIGADIDADAAKKSIERYNELARAGKDTDFGKKASRMFALETPPFYASKLTLSTMLVCMGGLESDAACHTFDENHELIEGLYVAGNVQGNRFKVQYPTTVPGISHSVALTEGRLAVKSVVEDHS